jgi:putative transposase
LLQDIKGSSSKWINEKGFIKGKFEWQEGYGAFSYSMSHIQNVIRYIENQEEHHRKKSFLEEYIDFLEEFEIEYNERFIFHEPI